jgi:hypothetical protein
VASAFCICSIVESCSSSATASPRANSERSFGPDRQKAKHPKKPCHCTRFWQLCYKHGARKPSTRLRKTSSSLAFMGYSPAVILLLEVDSWRPQFLQSLSSLRDRSTKIQNPIRPARISAEKSGEPSAAWAAALICSRCFNSGNGSPPVTNRPRSYSNSSSLPFSRNW